MIQAFKSLIHSMDTAARFELSQRFHFDAAHSLERHVSEAENESSLRIHGHSYYADVTLAGPEPTVHGMLLDLGVLRAEIERIRLMLDHRFLDEVQDLNAPTLENLCLFISRKFSLPGLVRVEVGRQSTGDRCALRMS